MYKSHSVLALIATVFISACSSSNDPVEESSVTTRYNGTYIYACAPEDENEPEGLHDVLTFSIDGTAMTLTVRSYNDSDCIQPAVPAETVLAITLEYAGDVVQTNLGAADAVNLTVQSGSFDGVAWTPEFNQLAAEDGTFNTQYDIFLLADSLFYAGENTETLDGTSAEARPNTLEAVPAVRQ